MYRCEVRPGPEFLTRSYTFHPSRHFHALQHYYTDSSCEDPAYSLMIRGKLRLRQASWITRGGTEAEHHLSKVGIVVHSLAAKQRLVSRLPQTCVGLTLGRAVPGKLYQLYNTRAGRGCLAALGFSMMEMGLIRVETQHHSHGGKIQELFLGDIHTDWTQRTQYRPTGYQQPLQNAMVSNYSASQPFLKGLIYSFISFQQNRNNSSKSNRETKEYIYSRYCIYTPANLPCLEYRCNIKSTYEPHISMTEQTHYISICPLHHKYMGDTS